MGEVLCWCCENYHVVYEHTTEKGLCMLREKIVLGNDSVCDEFIMRKGLYTKREIPDYCKNYNNQK